LGASTAPITDSMGIAVLPEDAPDATTLIEHADRALYTAKRIGIGTYGLPGPRVDVTVTGPGGPVTRGGLGGR